MNSLITYLGPMPTDLKIGSSCKSSLQCLLFIPNSHCDWDNRTCTCQPYYVLYNNTNCLPGKYFFFDSFRKLIYSNYKLKFNSFV